MERSTIFKNGKPSISIRAIYTIIPWRTVSHNQRVARWLGPTTLMWFSVMTRSLELGTVVRDFTGCGCWQFCHPVLFQGLGEAWRSSGSRELQVQLRMPAFVMPALCQQTRRNSKVPVSKEHLLHRSSAENNLVRWRGRAEQFFEAFKRWSWQQLTRQKSSWLFRLLGEAGIHFKHQHARPDSYISPYNWNRASN